ncbi:hypothetical protein Bca52824_035999 [Brassica carinata]|uniref:Uncharacterized protein n=1 Tax=Brassica carinata TaxID=52824 RepID=A0A8X7S453_BRACI|nr:hypothetical protein Bca52824_035999 [Brassica carinata]
MLITNNGCACGPGEYMAMEKLHSVILENYGNIWHHSRVRRYLTPENWAVLEAKGKAWYGLLMLLRKYPEHFKGQGPMFLWHESCMISDIL